MAHDQITFGIIFRKTSYAISEISNFIECADSVEPVEFRNEYICKRHFRRFILTIFHCCFIKLYF